MLPSSTQAQLSPLANLLGPAWRGTAKHSSDLFKAGLRDGIVLVDEHHQSECLGGRLEAAGTNFDAKRLVTLDLFKSCYLGWVA